MGDVHQTSLLSHTTSGNAPIPQQDVLSRWPWVDKATVESIANGEFDIYELPKLYREETLRNRYVTKSKEGVHFPIGGGVPTIIHTRTKLQSSFKDLSSFLSAWLIYISIRASYAPDRGPPLVSWTERLIFHVQLKYNFTIVLDYIVGYFLKYQNADPNTWFNVDPELHANTFGNAAQRTAVASTAVAGHSRNPTKSTVTQPVSEQICLNWNRKAVGCKVKELTGLDCQRRHVCRVCEDGNHRGYQCPKAAPPST